jgi:hypothetical protein
MNRMAVLVGVVLILCMGCVCAQNVSHAEGRVTVTIINEAPVVTGILFDPAVAYFDSEIRCIPEVQDESPEWVSYQYEWRVNGEIMGGADSLSGFDDNDEVSCRVIPVDAHGIAGDTYEAHLDIQARSASTRMLMGTAKLLGMDAHTEEVVAAQQSGGVAVTGYVVAGAVESPRFEGIMLVGVMLLLVININLTVRLITSRRKRLIFK